MGYGRFWDLVGMAEFQTSQWWFRFLVKPFFPVDSRSIFFLVGLPNLTGFFELLIRWNSVEPTGQDHDEFSREALGLLLKSREQYRLE